MMMKPRRSDVLVMLVSLALSLAAVELVVRAFPARSFRLVDPGFFGGKNWFEFDPHLGYVLLRDHVRTFTVGMDDDCGERPVEIRTNDMGVRDR